MPTGTTGAKPDLKHMMRRVRRELEHHFGVRGFYSPAQVTSAGMACGFSMIQLKWAHAAFCSPQQFEQYYPKTMANSPDQTALRMDILEVIGEVGPDAAAAAMENGWLNLSEWNFDWAWEGLGSLFEGITGGG